MDFKADQQFFLRHRSDRFLSSTEDRALVRYFIDERGDLRLYAPANDVVIAGLERWLIRHSRSKQINGNEQRAHAAAKRSLIEGLQKLDERQAKLAAEPVKPVNSLQTTGIGRAMIALLFQAGYRTKKAVELATDHQLLAIKGIDDGQLRRIRHYCPHVSIRTAKIQEQLKAGQASFAF